MPETEEEKKAREAKEAAEAAAKKAAEDKDKAQPFAVFPDAESFNKRVEREARRILKEAGIADPDPAKIKLVIDAYNKSQADAAAAEEAKKSEIQKAAEAKAKSDAEKEAAMSAKEEAEMKAHLYKVCAQQGIKNIDYAVFKIQTKLASLGDNEELDEEKFIQDLKAKPEELAALGIASTPEVKKEGATTTEQGAKPETKPPDAGGNAPQTKDVMQMTSEEFRNRTSSKYGFSGF